jgi:hypothetical protein
VIARKPAGIAESRELSTLDDVQYLILNLISDKADVSTNK